MEGHSTTDGVLYYCNNCAESIIMLCTLCFIYHHVLIKMFTTLVFAKAFWQIQNLNAKTFIPIKAPVMILYDSQLFVVKDLRTDVGKTNH